MQSGSFVSRKFKSQLRKARTLSASSRSAKHFRFSSIRTLASVATALLLESTEAAAPLVTGGGSDGGTELAFVSRRCCRVH